MTRTKEAEIPRWPALAGMCLVHAAVLVTLWPRDVPPVPHADTVLRVQWIERAPAPPVAVPAHAPPSPASPRPPAARTAAPAPVPVDVPPRAMDAGSVTPSSSALLEQAGAWAREQAPAADFTPDPLRRRPPPPADGRFAMRDPVSVEDVVVAVGRLFGGGPSNPCPRIRRNIAALGDGGDGDLLAEELRRLRQACL